MNRDLMSLLTPPLAVCRFGCAGCCALPIAVFWVAGISSLIYGYFGGPLALDTVSWNTLGLGAVLWLIATVWAMITLHSVKSTTCEKKDTSICNKISKQIDESDPLDEIKKAQ